MADKYLLETGVDFLLLEDGVSFLNLEVAPPAPPPAVLGPGRYTPLSDFHNQLNGKAAFNGSTWWMENATVAAIDFVPTVTYYVDYVTGDNADDGLTPATAFKYLNNACLAAIAGAVPAHIIIIDEIVGYLSTAVGSGWTFEDSIKISSGSPSGRTIIAQIRESYVGTFAWSDNADGTWSSSTNQLDHTACFDNLYQDIYGGAAPQDAEASGAACVANPGSFFWDGVSTMMVHMQDGREPDEDWIYCSRATSSRPLTFMNKIDGTVILENLTIYNNNQGVAHANLGGRCNTYTGTEPNTTKLGLKNILAYGASGRAVEFTDYSIIVMENVVCRYARIDGLNYHSISGVGNGWYMTAYEDRCVAVDMGWEGWKDQLTRGVSANGSTVHDNINIMRVGCEYQRGYGPMVADINGCDSWNFGVFSEYPNLSDVTDGTNAAFHTNGVSNDANNPARMILIGCDGGDTTTGTETAYMMATPLAEAVQVIEHKFWVGETPITEYGSQVSIMSDADYALIYVAGLGGGQSGPGMAFGSFGKLGG